MDLEPDKDKSREANNDATLSGLTVQTQKQFANGKWQRDRFTVYNMPLIGLVAAMRYNILLLWLTSKISSNLGKMRCEMALL